MFNLYTILFYGGDKKFINMLWLCTWKTGENNKLKLTALSIFKNKVNKRKKTQLKTEALGQRKKQQNAHMQQKTEYD